MSCHHFWRTWGRRGDKERCDHCKEVFPCADVDCGHADCIEWRLDKGPKPICVECRRPIDGQDPKPNLTVKSAGRTLALVTAIVRGRTKAFHSSCKTPTPAT